MSSTLFISDLHLCQSRPQTRDRFLGFLGREAGDAASLYILGDLFEYWVGDDDRNDPFNASVCIGLHELVRKGTAVYLMHGNRDFLLGADFAATTGVSLLPDLLLKDIAGAPTLLAHGDTLCTDDADYQRFRTEVRSTQWQQAFLAQSLPTRKAQVENLRKQSEMEKSRKPMALMDVNDDAVVALMRAQGWPRRLIHGHTHRPARHSLDIDGHQCERWVLAAWDETPSCLVIDAKGCRPLRLA